MKSNSTKFLRNLFCAVAAILACGTVETASAISSPTLTATAPPSSQYTYIVDPTLNNKVVEVHDQKGNIVATYMWAPLPTGPELVSIRVRQPDGSYKTYYPETDATNGSIIAVTDETGAVVGTQTYDAFGAITSSQGATAATPFPVVEGYRQAFDPDTGFIRMGERWYDPQTGRFVSTDPDPGNAVHPPSLNKYAYAENDPVNRYDPTGRYTIEEESATLRVEGEAASQAFSNVGKQAGGRAMNNLGPMTENAVQRLINQCLKPGANIFRNAEKLPIPGGGNAIPDFFITMGSKLHFVEVKYQLGASTSELFLRAAGQLKAAIQKSDVTLVLFKEMGAKNMGRMQKIVNEVSGAGTLTIANGLLDMAGLLSDFLIEGCLQ